MKLLITILSVTLLTSCMSHRGTLFINKIPAPDTSFQTGEKIYRGALTLVLFQKATKQLKRTLPHPIQLVGMPGSVYSYREYAYRMGVEMPQASNYYTITSEKIIGGMDYKDVWLSKGPPVAIFITEDFVTWRFKDESIVNFYQGKSLITNS